MMMMMNSVLVKCLGPIQKFVGHAQVSGEGGRSDFAIPSPQILQTARRPALSIKTLRERKPPPLAAILNMLKVIFHARIW